MAAPPPRCWLLLLLLQYDTVHGRYKGTVSHTAKELVVDGRPITVFGEKDPSKIAWAAAGAEYIVESTGAFLDKEKASAHFKGGAKRIILSAVRFVPGSSAAAGGSAFVTSGLPSARPAALQGRHAHDRRRRQPRLVQGVGLDRLQRKLHYQLPRPHRQGCASGDGAVECLRDPLRPPPCAAACAVIVDNFGFKEGLMTTVHAVTATQKTVDGPSSKVGGEGAPRPGRRMTPSRT